MSQSPSVIRLALLGAECSGKTTLARELSRQLNAHRVPEYLREFCEVHQRTPRPEEQMQVMHEQIRLEEAALSDCLRDGALMVRQSGGVLPQQAIDAPELSRLVVCDSTPLATALYSLDLFEDSSLLESALAHQRRYDLTFVAGVDIPWQPDGVMRDGPAARKRFDALLRKTLADQRISFLSLSGSLQQRLEQVRQALNTL